VLRTIEPQNLGEASLGSLHLGHDGGGVVGSELGISGSSGPGTSVLGVSEQRHRVKAGLVVRANRRANHEEQGL